MFYISYLFTHHFLQIKYKYWGWGLAVWPLFNSRLATRDQCPPPQSRPPSLLISGVRHALAGIPLVQHEAQVLVDKPLHALAHVRVPAGLGVARETEHLIFRKTTRMLLLLLLQLLLLLLLLIIIVNNNS